MQHTLSVYMMKVLCVYACGIKIALRTQIKRFSNVSFPYLQTLADPEVLRCLTSSVSSALDEAAAALTRMRAGIVLILFICSFGSLKIYSDTFSFGMLIVELFISVANLFFATSRIFRQRSN